MPGTERLRSALVERYAIERELGSGGMATVYLARDIKHDREVALKVLRADLSAVIGTERFLSEVRITARLDHPHILTLIDSGEADGILYYVLPYVRGESLRAKLNREKQLGIDEAIAITKQIASALDYAHSHGVVHRDIKPENILLHEGEAVLADFGIALAVKEAGGNRLTETGLSLGTPQYMSPEQATSDRSLDKRTDIYSLGAVFYEMLAGEPPITGASATAIVAKLLTEQPVKLRVVRPAVSRAIEAATARTLSKTPADRYSSAGDFVRALTAPESGVDMRPRRKAVKWSIAVAAVAVIAVGIWKVGISPSGSTRRNIGVRDRVQVTTSGDIQFPSMSSDGKALAYIVSDCKADGCQYAAEIRDIGGSSRRIIEGLTNVGAVELSPDRRHAFVVATYEGRFGTYLVPTLGGEPRRLAAHAETFWADGDSLLLAEDADHFDSTWIRVADLNGVVGDSIPVRHAADFVLSLNQVPNSARIIYGLQDHGVNRWYSIDRRGREYAILEGITRFVSAVVASNDALWVGSNPNGWTTDASIIRIPFDRVSGTFGRERDTVYVGTPTGVSVTGDGATLMVDEGVAEYSGWALPFDALINDKFSEDKRLYRSTKVIIPSISPDGSRVVSDHGAGDGDLHSWYVTSYPRGPEKQIPGTYTDAVFSDSNTVALRRRSRSGVRYSLFDPITQKEVEVLTVNDPGVRGWVRAGNAWGWISATGKELNVQRRGESKPRQSSVAKWFKFIFYLNASPRGDRLAISGVSLASSDSIHFGVLSLTTGEFTPVWSVAAQSGTASWIDEETLLIDVSETKDSHAFYRVKLKGKSTRLGSTRRPTLYFDVSRDLKRAITITVSRHSDAWTMKVVR
ncbi:MAG: serine/threonine-protein kinase [Gemmatimonadales bacterium]